MVKLLTDVEGSSAQKFRLDLRARVIWKKRVRREQAEDQHENTTTSNQTTKFDYSKVLNQTVTAEDYERAGTAAYSARTERAAFKLGLILVNDELKVGGA